MSNRTSTDMWYKRHCGDRAKEMSRTESHKHEASWLYSHWDLCLRPKHLIVFPNSSLKNDLKASKSFVICCVWLYLTVKCLWTGYSMHGLGHFNECFQGLHGITELSGWLGTLTIAWYKNFSNTETAHDLEDQVLPVSTYFTL
jgi:hypothetical protein